MGLLNKKATYTWLLNEKEQSELFSRIQNKEYAMAICRSYIARNFSQGEFRINDDRWQYKFNVKPNYNQSATEFWQKFIQQLYTNGEALIIMTDTNELLVADYFSNNIYATKPSFFSGVIVNDYEFQRTFSMRDVFYLKLDNDNFTMLTDGLYRDYGTLLGLTLDGLKKNTQLRGSIRVPKTKILDQTELKKTESMINNIKSRLLNDRVAVWPENENLKFEELNHTSGSSNNFKLSDADQLFTSYVDKVAISFGIPPVLLHGEQADSSTAKQEFYDSCLEPLFRMVETELTGKLNIEVNIIGPNKPNVFKMAESVDKLISSGAFNRNEIRELLGYDSIPGLDEFVITKNYERSSNLKGGDYDE